MTNTETLKIEDFISKYSTIYMFMFEGKQEVVEQEKSVMSKISDFLFEPRYKVENLNFKLLG